MEAQRDFRVALIGSGGMLGSMVQKVLPKGWRVFPLDLPQFDMGDRGQVLDTLNEASPHFIINCAAYTDVDGCESNRDMAHRANGLGPGNLAEAARGVGAKLVHVSTDYVFDGKKGEAYVEQDLPSPQSVYGDSKLAGERAILESGLQQFFIVRTSWLYGPYGKNFVETVIRLAKEREELRIVADQIGSPTYSEDLARGLLRLLETEDFGVYHFSNRGSCSWYEFAVEIISLLQQNGESLEVKRIVPIKTEEYPLPAPRPAFSVLSTQKYRSLTGETIPGWKEGLARYIRLRENKNS